MADPNSKDGTVQEALRQLEVAANNIAIRADRSAAVRTSYVAQIKEMSASLWDAYKKGEISAQRAAEVANESRNEILKMARANDMDLGRAYAESLKKTGLKLDEVVHYIMNQKDGFKQRFAGKAFTSLTPAQQAEIYEEVIKSAGRDRGATTKAIPRLRWAARGLWIASAAIALYNIGTSQNPWWQTGREAANIGGGLIGSIAGGAAAGAAGGVWGGPIGVGIGVVVGGVLGALLADHAYMEAAGSSDPYSRGFIARFTSFWTGMDEAAMAEALAREYPEQLDFVVRVIEALRTDYSSDADDVAYEYVRRVRADRTLGRAVRSHHALRQVLISAMSSGWVSGSETDAIFWLNSR